MALAKSASGLFFSFRPLQRVEPGASRGASPRERRKRARNALVFRLVGKKGAVLSPSASRVGEQGERRAGTFVVVRFSFYFCALPAPLRPLSEHPPLLSRCVEASQSEAAQKGQKPAQNGPKSPRKLLSLSLLTMHAKTSLAMVVVEYDFFERGLPDLPTPLLSSSSACARTPDLASASTCGPQQPEVAPMPMMKTRRGRFRRKVAGFAAAASSPLLLLVLPPCDDEEGDADSAPVPLLLSASLSSSTSSYQICVPSSGELMYGMLFYSRSERFLIFFFQVVLR